MPWFAFAICFNRHSLGSLLGQSTESFTGAAIRCHALLIALAEPSLLLK
jgi:hypothetical protein